MYKYKSLWSSFSGEAYGMGESPIEDDLAELTAIGHADWVKEFETAYTALINLNESMADKIREEGQKKWSLDVVSLPRRG